nr:putative transposase [Ipomoea batatas]
MSESVYKCFKCLNTWEDGVLRYKVQVRVVDMKGNASFMLWDLECMELIGIGASDLHELHKDSSTCEGADGPIKRCLIDAFSSTQGCKKGSPQLRGARRLSSIGSN